MKKNKSAEHPLVNYNSGYIERPTGERWVTMSNALVRAGCGLTLAEKRIIALAASKLDSQKAIPVGQAPTTRITAAEYVDIAGCEPHTAYEALKTAAKHLYNRSITFYEAAYSRKGKPIEPTFVQMRWIGSAKYHKGEGWIELHWWHQLVPHLLGLQRRFTSYQLQQAGAIRSIYSWRLLELLMRFKSTGWAEYSIEDFCVSMDASEKQRANFNNIKRRIIEPAVKELNEKDGWIIQWQPIKAGRRVKAVRFDFEKNPQGRLL